MLYRFNVLDISIGDGPGRKRGGDPQTPPFGDGEAVMDHLRYWSTTVYGASYADEEWSSTSLCTGAAQSGSNTLLKGGERKAQVLRQFVAAHADVRRAAHRALDGGGWHAHYARLVVVPHAGDLEVGGWVGLRRQVHWPQVADSVLAVCL